MIREGSLYNLYHYFLLNTVKAEVLSACECHLCVHAPNPVWTGTNAGHVPMHIPKYVLQFFLMKIENDLPS